MVMTLDQTNIKIAVLGMGYVGLPLAVEFGKRFTTLGYDINANRIVELKGGADSTLELTPQELSEAKNLKYTSDTEDLKNANVYIVTVPTPIDENKQPDLTPLINASIALGSVINRGDTVIYESTVFPGATEEICVPELEKKSGLVMNIDFFVGYSPERINPGDKNHGVKSIVKVTSGSNPETAIFVDELYGSIISAGTFKASSIKVAEAAKVIENTQRDLNIALINELAIIFNALDIDTESVLEAAGTKWNFINFKPGLVGGHCIGVDPYYLTHKAQSIGYVPEVILAGRRMNDGMGKYVARQLVKELIKKKIQVHGAKVLIMGFTFKENCPDIRNTKVVDVITELKDYGVLPEIYDPWVEAKDAASTYGVSVIEKPLESYYDALVLAVAHDLFKEMSLKNFSSLLKPDGIIYDLKWIQSQENSDLRL
jgi:UDP-N-acetyl-D-galactosamine dehydrogenase